MEPDKLYFFTATILNWKHLLSNDAYKLIVINELRTQVERGKIKLYAFVIMPNHIHLILSIPAPNDTVAVQRDMMKWISKSIIADLRNNNNPLLEEFKVDAADRNYQIWERNPLAIELYSREVIFQKLNYIHLNPVKEKWKLVSEAEDYKFSTAGYYYDGRYKWDFVTHLMD